LVKDLKNALWLKKKKGQYSRELRFAGGAWCAKSESRSDVNTDEDDSMSDCYRASDDDVYDDPSSPHTLSSTSSAAASTLPSAARSFSLVPNKWHNPLQPTRSEILCHLSEIAEHDTMRGAMRLLKQALVAALNSLTFPPVCRLCHNRVLRRI
jgi:hypothetical protein